MSDRSQDLAGVVGTTVERYGSNACGASAAIVGTVASKRLITQTFDRAVIRDTMPAPKPNIKLGKELKDRLVGRDHGDI